MPTLDDQSHLLYLILMQTDRGKQSEWRFTGQSLRRAKIASHLARDLDVNTPGVALAPDLLKEIKALHKQLNQP